MPLESSLLSGPPMSFMYLLNCCFPYSGVMEDTEKNLGFSFVRVYESILGLVSVTYGGINRFCFVARNFV